MKHIARFAIAAIALFAAWSCTEDPIEVPATNTEETFSMSFSADIFDLDTKSTLTTEDETNFKAAWTEGDNISIRSVDGSFTDLLATWNSTNKCFDISGIPIDLLDKTVQILAIYPDGGGLEPRIQSGDTYNSDYDHMEATTDFTFSTSSKNIIQMHRTTAILYFHLKSDLDDEIESATLTVGNQTITTEYYNVNAKDAVLWFNITPVTNASISLELTSENGSTLTLERKSTATYTAGKVYTIKKKDVEWVAPVPSGSYTIVFGNETKSATQITATTKASTVIAEGTEYVLQQPFSEMNCAYYGDNHTSIRLGKASESGSLTIALSETGQVNATSIVVNAYLYSSTKVFGLSINNSEMQTIGSSASDYSFELDGETLSSITIATGGYIYVNTITVNYGPVKPSLSTPANLAVVGKTVTWTAVENADSYLVTIGTNEAESVTTTSYVFEGTDEYYNVSVVAVPSDPVAYKNSVPATLTDACFGTPTLTTPTLVEGTKTDKTLSATWTVDSRATNGYYCELYNGTTKVGDSKTVESGSVSFDGLTASTTYTVKVNAIAVTGDKPYAESSVAIKDITTDEEKTGTPTYVKVTSNSDLEDGKYLIICESEKVALDGSLASMDVANNTVSVNITSSTIAPSTTIDGATFTYSASNGSFLSSSGKYIYHSGTSNTLNTSTSVQSNTVSIDSDGNAVINCGSTYVLRYNASDKRFRYYKGTQKAIQLYKYDESYTGN